MPVRFLSKLHIDSNPVEEYAREQQAQTYRRTSKKHNASAAHRSGGI